MVLAITMDGQKDVISLQIGENESSKFWLSVLNVLKNRGVKDVMGNFPYCMVTDLNLQIPKNRVGASL